MRKLHKAKTNNSRKKKKLHRNYFIEAGHYWDILLVDRDVLSVPGPMIIDT